MVGLKPAPMVQPQKINPYNDVAILGIVDSYNDEHGDFKDFEAVDAVVTEYEETTGISLGVIRSKEVALFRTYGCKEHVGYGFRLRF